MTPDEIREFEKTGKALSKLKGSEILFEEDVSGRQQYAAMAMNDNRAALQAAVDEIMKEDGVKNIVRALNNLKSIDHHGSLCFAKVLFDAAEPSFERAAAYQKLIQLLDGVTENLRCGMQWLSDKALAYLGRDISRQDGLELWLHWAMAMLRSCNDAGLFIEQIGHTRPKDLQRAAVNGLRECIDDEKAPWDKRSAALYLLLANRLIGLEKARYFIEQAYVGFPLEALEGVEILAIAIESDASALAEFDVIEEKLAQIRKENLILKNMDACTFETASLSLFAQLGQMPIHALDVALLLPMLDKNERMIASIFIDDTRKAEWMHMASKNPEMLQKFASCFFKNIAVDNPILRTFSLDLVSCMLENCNIDARMAEAWQAAVESEDLAAIESEKRHWVS